MTIKPKPSWDTGWTEPESEATLDSLPEYPFNNATITRSGHSFEMDDTKGRERVRLSHGGAQTEGVGTYFEMQADGDMVTKVVKDNYEIIAGKNDVLIKGVCYVTIEGDSVLHVKGNRYERVDGDLIREVRGRLTETIVGDITTSSLGDISINAGNPEGLLTKGTIILSAADFVSIDSDLNVEGSITADMITAVTKVNGGTQVTAGPLGFVSEAGGLSVGVPVAVPLTVTAASVVTAPIISGTLVRDATGTMMTMRLQHNIHNHMAFKGPTSTPLKKMI